MIRDICPRCGGATEVDPGEYVPLCFCSIAPPDQQTDPLDVPVYSERQYRGSMWECFILSLLIGGMVGFCVSYWVFKTP